MTSGGTGEARRRLDEAARALPWHWRLISALLVGAALIAVMDVLATAVSAVVEHTDGSWPWGQAAGASAPAYRVVPTDLNLASVHLLIAVRGDELTATYTLTSSSGRALAVVAQAAQSAGNSDLLVNKALGGVSVAQFRNGFAPNRYESTALGFMTPQLTVTGTETSVTIDSAPYRLLLGQQYLKVAAATSGPGSPGDLEFTYPAGLAVLDVVGASLAGAAHDDPGKGLDRTDLPRGTATGVTATLREPGTNWTTGLRSVGGMNLPLGGSALQRLASLVSYAALLWSLSRICRSLSALPDEVRPVVLASRNAVSVIVGALIALSALGFGYQLMFDLHVALVDPLLAGPVGLAVAGTFVLWPVLCWRVAPPRDQAADEDQEAAEGQAGRGNPAVSGRSWLDLVPLSVIAVGYLVLVAAWSGARGFWVTWWQVGLAVPAVLVLVYLLGRLLLGRSGLGPRARTGVLAGLLAVVLGSTLAWPVLVYIGFYEGHHVLHVNLIGKWIYLAAAIVAVTGLCGLTARVIHVLAVSHLGHHEAKRRMWRRTWRLGGGAVLAVVLAATVPWLIGLSRIRDPRVPGLWPGALTSYTATANLFRALPQLLNWLFLALAIAVLLAISRATTGPGETEAGHVAASRVAARRLAIPVMMLILFSAYTYYYHPWVVSDYTWLYLPVTPLLGLLVLTWALPAGQAEKDRTLPPGPAIRMTLRAWHNADFAGSQRQQLLGNADDLRKDLLSEEPRADADRTFFKLARAQNRLAERRDSWRRRAREHLRDAFDHYGEAPDPGAGRRGAVAGALLGLAPAVMLFLKTRPAPAWSGYPVLDFLGFTAWIVLIWPVLGWAMGYFLPFIRGHNGTAKALCVYVALCASLPMNLLWLDGSEWRVTAIYYLAAFAFLVLVGVVIGDLMELVSAGLSPLAWVQAHNWQFLVTWSTAVIAAIGTATAAFLSTAATDLGQQTVIAVTGQSAAGSAPVHG